MHKFLKVITVILSAVLLAALCTACGSHDEPAVTVSDSMPAQNIETVATQVEAVSLSEEDVELLAVMGDDILVLDDDSYAAAVTELMYHVGEFNGLVYQLEGVYTTQMDVEGTPYVYRTLVNGEETTVAALPIVYLEQNVAEGSWVRVTGIVGTAELGGAQATVLEIVTIENIDAGAAELAWAGSEHAHGSVNAG